MITQIKQRYDFHSIMYLVTSWLVLMYSPRPPLDFHFLPKPPFLTLALCISTFGLVSGLRAQYKSGNWKWLAFIGAFLNLLVSIQPEFIIVAMFTYAALPASFYLAIFLVSIFTSRFLYRDSAASR